MLHVNVLSILHDQFSLGNLFHIFSFLFMLFPHELNGLFQLFRQLLRDMYHIGSISL